ncbi:MAG: hypothetical protein IPM54_44240 [Polyangiaceae bacterium]|nr:hypothetical protein [Polyangiaceae bacterium]
MQLNEFIGSTGYEILQCFDYDGYDALHCLNGKPSAKKWKPIRVRRVRPSRRQGFRPSDAPWACVGDILVFRRSAVDALRDILDAHGELLPLEDEGGVELYAYNPRALDALDQVLSKGPRDDDGKLEGATYHVFIPSLVQGVDVFRLARERCGDIYVSDRFVERWKQAKLKGLDFRLVWDSDLPPEGQPGPWKPGQK